MADAGQLEIATASTDGRYVVELRGELDLATAERLQTAIDSAEVEPDGELLLDLRAVEFVDSTGLRVILTAHENLGERGVTMLVANGRPQVARLLALTGADAHLNIVAAP